MGTGDDHWKYSRERLQGDGSVAVFLKHFFPLQLSSSEEPQFMLHFIRGQFMGMMLIESFNSFLNEQSGNRMTVPHIDD